MPHNLDAESHDPLILRSLMMAEREKDMLALLDGSTTVAAIAARHGVTTVAVRQWKMRFLAEMGKEAIEIEKTKKDQSKKEATK